MIRFYLLIFISFITGYGFAQEARNIVRQGNKSYEKGDLADAEVKYKNALEKNPTSFEANFNLGDVFYNFENYDEAAQYFNKAQNLTDDKFLKAKALHNLGNAHFKKEEYKESVDAYKSALRNNPKDEETRKNLSLAMKYLKEQEQSNCENPDKNKDDKNEENKDDKKNNDKGDENKENEQQNQENKNEDGKQDNQEQQQQPQEQESKLSKEDAQRILDAMNNEEKNTRDKIMQQQMRKAQPVKIEKDW